MSHIIFLLLVSLMLVTPIVVHVFGWTPESMTEQRTLAPMPALHVGGVVHGTYQRAVDAYVNDAFGFRPIMVQLLTTLYLNVLHTSPIDRVLVGKDQWLFLNEHNKVLDTIGVRQYTEEELARFAEVFRRREAYFAERNIPYVYVVVPNKQTIYPEQLPFPILPHQRSTKTDQLIAIIEQETDISVIDLRPVLRDARDTAAYPLYIPTDTHWQPTAAHLSYLVLLDAVQTKYPELFAHVVPQARVLYMQVARGGDLAKMLGQQARYQDPFVQMIPADGADEPTYAVPITEYKNPTLDRFIAYEQKNNTLPRAVVFRDSFGEALLPFVSEPFSRTAYLWSPFIYDYIIEAEQPDIVIQFMVERLQQQLLADPKLEGGF